ncbi:MAG: galactose oxidase-like domain-containing protein [Planctomycetota bacterium]
MRHNRSVSLASIFQTLVCGCLLLWIGSRGISLTAAQEPATVVGEWGPVIALPHIPVHMALLHTGKIVFWAYDNTNVSLWDPVRAAFTPIPNNTNMFCAGQTQLADGRLLVAGGHVENNEGLPDTNIFDPVTETWTQAGDMSVGRWYPTCTTLSDGRVMVASGDVFPGVPASTPEVLSPGTMQWTPLPGATRWQPLYPFHFVLPSDTVFDAGSADDTYTLDLSTQLWNFVGWSGFGGGSAVQYRPGKIMKSGGYVPATNETAYIDLTVSSPSWTSIEAMSYPRNHHNLVILPDGKVLVVGGTTSDDEPAYAVFAAEMWNPTTLEWTNMASMSVPRMYHSTALLLPDGKVLSAGGDYYPNAQIYHPPYLFSVFPRPELLGAPPAAAYGSEFAVECTDSSLVDKVVLIRNGAVTHAFDHSQRYVPLTATQTSATSVLVNAPANGALAPPGYYMLFLVSANDIPSEARFIRIGANLFVRGNVNGDGSVNIADAIAILSYLFGFAPAPVPIAAADSNDDGLVNIADAIYLLSFLFNGGPAPPPPFPVPGEDPTP